MTKKLLKGLSEIYIKYDAFFIDIWGVIHNGIKLKNEAIIVLNKLKKLNKRFVLMSNAPRPSSSVKKFLLKLNMEPSLVEATFTSGEAALRKLRQNIYGKNFFHLGPKRDHDLIKNFKKNKTTIDKCNFILCTGLLDEKVKSLKFYENFLKNYTYLKMVCTNPDLIVHRGSKKEYCAGSIAKVFEGLGGNVIYFGKPYPEIYNSCLKQKENILVIGDNIRTDIIGANNMKFDSILIMNGVHKEEFLNCTTNNYDQILNKYNAKTNYYQKELIW